MLYSTPIGGKNSRDKKRCKKNLDLGNGRDRRIIDRIIPWVKSERNGIFLKSENKADDST
jgi:hypothetical protein